MGLTAWFSIVTLFKQGPWFESIDWLADVWVPQAQQLGLRYVAHIVQADRPHDCLGLNLNQFIKLPFELQLFKDGEAARDWLRQVRDPALASTYQGGGQPAA